MSRIRALALGVGLVSTMAAGGAVVWLAGSTDMQERPATGRDLALAGAVGATTADVVSAVERGLVAPRARPDVERSRSAEPVPAPAEPETPVEQPITTPAIEVPVPPVSEAEPVAVPVAAPVPATVAVAAEPAGGAVGITALEPGEMVSVTAGWNGANAAEPELPVIRAGMPAVRLGGIGGGQCGGRRGGGTLVLR